jgi:enoyl-CoA hydratase/carnithine racemase
MDLKAIRYATSDGIGIVTLDRPDRLNAWTNRMEAEYHWCLATADADPDVRVIVVTGAGRGFCAGADTAALDGYAEGAAYDLTAVDALPAPEDVRGDWRGAFTSALGLAKPVIAAINGPAAGVGFVLACFADIRFAAAGAKLTTSFARLGLPAEHGVAWVLPRLVGAGRAADLLYSSRVIEAGEALEIGLVNRVYAPAELLPATLAYARAMAAECSPAALHVIKRQLWGALLDPLDRSWQDATARMVAMIAEPDFVEGVAAYREKREPRFPGVAHGAPPV